MTGNQPLILQVVQAGAFASLPKPTPNTVIVITYGDGRAEVFTRRAALSNRFGSSKAFVVDVSDHVSQTVLALPAHGDTYFFQATFAVKWRVSDPVEVVRRNVQYGQQLALGILQSDLRRISRRHSPLDAAGAEDEIAYVLQVPIALSEGIEIMSCGVQLSIDSRLLQRVVDVDDSDHRGNLDNRALEDAATRVDTLRRVVDGEEALLFYHLAQFPGDSEKIMQLIAAGRDRDEQSKERLLERLFENKLVQDADVEALLDRVLGRSRSTKSLGYSSKQLSSGGTGADSRPTAHDWVDQEPDAPVRSESETAQVRSDGGVAKWKPIGSGRGARNG